MVRSKHALKDADYELLNFFSPGYPFIHLESGKSSLSLEDDIRYGGKYVIYGSKKYVKKLAEKLEPKIGGVIEGMKYSTVPIQETPNAPKNKHTLLVYCNKMTRTEVMKILERAGVEFYEWKSTRDTWGEVLNSNWYCLNLYHANPENFRELCRLVDRMDRFEFMEFIMKLATEYAAKFKVIAEILEKTPEKKWTWEEIKELFKQIKLDTIPSE